MSSLVLKIPACTRVQGQSANPALLSTRLLSVELTATLTPPRYLLTQSHCLSSIKNIWACTSYIYPVETRVLTASSSVSCLLVSVAQCKLDYQACITGKKIAVKCPGMCPCPAQSEQSSAEKKGTRFCTHYCTLQAILPRETVFCWVQTHVKAPSWQIKALPPWSVFSGSCAIANPDFSFPQGGNTDLFFNQC